MPQVEAPFVAQTSPFEDLPFNFVQEPSRLAAFFLLMLLVPVLGAVIVPVLLILAFAAEDVRHAAADKPLAVSLLALGLLMWFAFFLVPTRKIFSVFWKSRSVSIAAGRVTVTEGGLFGSKLWTAALSDFSGIAHHVRATLSGVRHELLLVHRERRRTVLLHTANRISQSTVDRASGLLQLPQLPAGELYRFMRSPAVPAFDASAQRQTVQA